jgi:hypothetical protein
MRFFFYGTLTDPDLLALLLGSVEVEPAALAGWRRVALPRVPWPGIMPAETDRVDGLLTGLLGARRQRRLRRYEGVAYRVVTVRVARPGRAGARGTVAAALFVPRRLPDSAPDPASDWNILQWRRRAKPRALAAIRRAFRFRG